jgi:hypothetical protein
MEKGVLLHPFLGKYGRCGLEATLNRFYSESAADF